MEFINENDIVKKFPKSINGSQCIGPCYNAKTLIIHPLEMSIITNKNNFCPINSGTDSKMLTDICLNPIDSNDINYKDLEITMLNPYIDFNSFKFLSIYYNILSIEDTYKWLDENKKSSLDTKIRILRNALFAFSSKIELIDNRLSDIFVHIIKKKYINKIYNNIYKYISVERNNILFMENNLDKKENYVERINFIVKVFINTNELNKFLIKYFSQKKELLITNYIDDIINEFVKYIIVKIKKSI